MLSQNESRTPSVEERDRTTIPEKYKWDLSHIYADEKVWTSEKGKFVARLSEVAKYKGKLGESPQMLLGCFDLVTDLSKEYTRLYCYASMHSDEDTRLSKYLGMEQEIGQIGSDFSARVSFLQPEILNIGRDRIEAFLQQEPKL